MSATGALLPVAPGATFGRSCPQGVVHTLELESSTGDTGGVSATPFGVPVLGAVMLKLLLIRHCQATAQHPDAPLTATGIDAAEALALRLRDLSPDALYSSPYERAHATVRPFAVLAGFPIRFDDRLRERVLSDHDLEDWLDHMRRSFAEPNYRAPGGESLNQAQSRAIAALADIAAAGHRLPAGVSHGNLIASVLRSMDDMVRVRAVASLAQPGSIRSGIRCRPAGQVRPAQPLTPRRINRLRKKSVLGSDLSDHDAGLSL